MERDIKAENCWEMWWGLIFDEIGVISSDWTYGERKRRETRRTSSRKNDAEMSEGERLASVTRGGSKWYLDVPTDEAISLDVRIEDRRRILRNGSGRNEAKPGFNESETGHLMLMSTHTLDVFSLLIHRARISHIGLIS